MKGITVAGKSYRSIREACSKLHMDEATIYHRVKHKGMTYEEAFSLPLVNCIYSKDHLGNVYRSFNAMCAAWGLPRDSVAYRLNVGWSLKKALTTKSQRDPNKWVPL